MNDYPPSGELREPVKNINRADCVVFTKELPENKIKKIIDSYEIPTFEADINFNISNQSIKSGVSFCGIADPDSFASTLIQIGADIVEFQKFRDHYVYNERDMSRLRKLLRKEKADALVTTEKDWVKLPASEKESGLIVPITVDVTWLNDGEARLKEALQRL